MVAWDGLTPGAWIAGLAESDICINLAGRSLNCRYNAANRRNRLRLFLNGFKIAVDRLPAEAHTGLEHVQIRAARAAAQCRRAIPAGAAEMRTW